MGRDESLARLSQLCGIQLHYPDIWGQEHEVSTETQEALLGAMGVEDVDAALAEREAREWRRLLPPAVVVRDRARVTLRVPREHASAAWV